MFSAKFLLLGCLGLTFLLAGAQRSQASTEDKNVKAWVFAEQTEGGLVHFRPRCNSKRAMVVEYLLVVEKKAPGGSSISKQAGRAQLKPNVECDLSTVSINLAPGDKCRVQFSLTSEGQVVARDDFWFEPVVP